MTRHVLLVALVLAGAMFTGCYNSRPPHIGNPAQDFTVQDSDKKVSLNQFRGQVVVLNFWGTFCPPCIDELPSMMDMQDRLRARGVVVLGVSIDEDDDAYHRFLKHYNVNFVTVRDGQKRVAGMYGTSGWPETYIIDRQGIVRRKFIGAVNWDSPEVMQFLAKL